MNKPLLIESRLLTVLAQLEMISQVPAAELGYSARTADHPGGRRPIGGLDNRADKEDEFPHKSVEYFRRRVARAHTDATLKDILADAEKALVAWRVIKRWEDGEAEPERKTLRWKRMIADSPDPVETLMRRHEIGRRTVYYYREMFGEQISLDEPLTNDQ